MAHASVWASHLALRLVFRFMISVTEMPFYLRLASNEPSASRKITPQSVSSGTSTLLDLCHGIGLGLSVLVAIFALYWIIGAHIASFPDLQSLQNDWFAYR